MVTQMTGTRNVVCAAGVSLALLVGGAAALAPQGQAPVALGATQAQAAQLYPDTPSDAWYVTQGWLGYVTSKGYMSGYADSGLFGPEDTVTRAQVAVVLLRWNEPGDTSSTNPARYGKVTNFSDVPAGQWYTSAVEYCRLHGVITGDTDANGNSLGTFRPNDPVTREELATMLYRQAVDCGAGAGSASLTSFPDASRVSSYALAALSWSVANGVLTGDTTSGAPMLNPASNATRAQLAKMVTVFFRDVFASTPEDPSGTGSSDKPAEKTWHETKPAWDEQVLVKDAWDEQVLVKEAWDEQVLTVPEWYEQVVVGTHHRFYYDDYIAYTDDEAINHAFELAQQGIETNAYYLEYDFDTIYHPDTYETVHHDAEYTTVHHEAEYKTVHHDAEGYWA